MPDELGPIEVIRMQTPGYGTGEPCVACGEPCEGECSLPIFNGDIVSNDWPGDWGGVPCCNRCYELHASGRMKTWDHLHRHHVEGFVGGDGI